MKKKFQQLFKKSESLSTEQYKKIKAVESRLGILHGLCKILSYICIYTFCNLVTNLRKF